MERELTGNDAFTLDPEAIVRYENSNRLELQYKIEKVEIQYREDKGYWPHGPVANYPRPVDVGDNWGARDAKANFITDYIKRIPSYIRELETDESLRYIAKKFNEREGVEHIDSSDLKVDMPDNFYTKKDEYLQAGIIFCPHVNNTGVSVNVIGNKIGSFCDVGTFSGSNDDAGQNHQRTDDFLRRHILPENQPSPKQHVNHRNRLVGKGEGEGHMPQDLLPDQCEREGNQKHQSVVKAEARGKKRMPAGHLGSHTGQ